MAWDKGSKVWAGYGDAVEVVRGLVQGKIREDLFEAPDPPVPIEYHEPGLRQYQNAGVAYLLANKRAILADDMGLGKSAQALVAAKALNQKTLIVCYSYAKGVWAPDGEIKKWWGVDAVILSGVKDRAPIDAKVVLVNYDILHAWLPEILAWGPQVLIVDEAQALIGEESRRSKAVRSAGQNCSYRWYLTGTPMPNRVRDLFPILDSLCPGRFGRNFFEFGMRYCNGHKVEIQKIGKTVYDFMGASHEAELQRRLKWLMLRRTKADVALELPTKTRQIIWVDLPRSKKGRSGWGPDASQATIRAVLDRTADAKLPQGLDIVLGHAERGRVVVFCWRREVAAWVAESARANGVEAELVYGGLLPERRKKYIARASTQERGLLAVTIDSCATAVDFSWAHVGVVLELSHEPHKLLQAESRLHRFGAKHPILIQYICARGSADEVIADRVIGKLAVEETVVGERTEGIGADLGGELSEAEILAEIMALGS
jgi:SNF2 family DNA or RNA helicase